MKLFSLEKSVGAVLFRIENNEPKFLLLRYRNGHWGFPKGHIENGEGHWETLAREVREETNISDVDIIPGFFQQERYWYFAKGEEKEKRIANEKGIIVFKKVFYYLARTEKESVILCEEHTGFEWLLFQEALEMITFRNSRKILKKAMEFMKKKLKIEI